MKTATRETMISKDLGNKKLVVIREFDAPLEQVWRAWTESKILDQWWAPKPWKAITKSMDFSEGGVWLYYMLGPEGEKNYCRGDFETIDALKSYSVISAFCDEQGKLTGEIPGMHWKTEFSRTETGTKVEVEITFASEEDLNTIVEMGFKEGFTAAHGNLDELLAGGAY